MINLAASTEQDIKQITDWTESDPYHIDIDPEWWLTGNGSLAFQLRDNIGPICYVRIDNPDSDNLMKLHTQFAPYEQVSKIRLLKAMIECVPKVEQYCRNQRAAGIVFESTSPLLISFMDKKFRFKPAGGDTYLLSLQEGV